MQLKPRPPPSPPRAPGHSRGLTRPKQAGKMNQILRCELQSERARWSYLSPSGLPAVSRKKNLPESHIINPLLTELVRPRWLGIGLVLILQVYGPRLSLGSQTRKKRTWPISSHLTSHLVNNPYFLFGFVLSCRLD